MLSRSSKTACPTAAMVVGNNIKKVRVQFVGAQTEYDCLYEVNQSICLVNGCRVGARTHAKVL